MEQNESHTGARALLALLLVGALGVGLWLTSKSDHTPVPAPSGPSVEPEPLPSAKAAPPPTHSPAPDAAAADEADAPPRAAEPTPEAFALARGVQLTCDVVPTSAAGKAELRHVTWPGPTSWIAPQVGAEMVAPRHPVTVEDGILTGSLTFPTAAGDAAVRHEMTLTMDGFAPTTFSFVLHGPEGEADCLAPISLESAARGVVGTVRQPNGAPMVGAVVQGCGARTVTGSDGDYFLLPRDPVPCTLRARDAPGSAALSAPVEVTLTGEDDQVIDFTLTPPDVADPGVQLYRSETGEVWLFTDKPEVPWYTHAQTPGILLSVGDVDATELSDAELLAALVSLAQEVHIQHRFETADGTPVNQNTTVSEL